MPDNGDFLNTEAPDSEKRPFKVAFYYDLDPNEAPDVATYIRDTVRRPTGPIKFGSQLDGDSQPIPPGPDGDGAYDADLVIKVTSSPRDSPECVGEFAVGKSFIFEPLTQRPIFGQILMCRAQPSNFLPNTLQFVVHEFLHILGFDKDLYTKWVGADTLEDVVRKTPASGPPPGSIGPTGIGTYHSFITPNMVREARAHFACPQMDGVLMEEAGNKVTDHWSMRHYNGALMRAGFTGESTHYGREAFTDILLALLQDTGWYDVQYGSGAFNTYGYKAGCAFVSGTFEDALADPVASKYLCSPEDAGTATCFSDFSGQGVCRAQRREEGREDYDLFTVDLADDNAELEDCQPSPGGRCINEYDDDNGEGNLICVPDFNCSDSGQVLVEGFPCTDFVSGCPPDDLMCGDPGLLTCTTPELNDCNSRGDCFKGRCMCHLGWGGDACTIRACTSGCPAGKGPDAPCPPSGFCGVPTCGKFSVGDTGKGTPCTSN